MFRVNHATHSPQNLDLDKQLKEMYYQVTLLKITSIAFGCLSLGYIAWAKPNNSTQWSVAVIAFTVGCCYLASAGESSAERISAMRAHR